MRRSTTREFRKILGLGYLFAALIFLQGAQLHVHIYDHDPGTAGHVHQAHPDLLVGEFDAPDDAHGDKLGQISLSQSALLKLSPSAPLIAILLATVALLLPVRSRGQLLRPCTTASPFPSTLPGRRPPLRAPPP